MSKTTAKTNKNANQSKITQPFLLVMVAVASGFFGGYFGSQSTLIDNPNDTATVQREIIEGEGDLINTIVKDVDASVVSVNVKGLGTSTDFFGFGQEFETESAGTGFVISDSGLIITNRHVVPTDTTEVSVTLSDGTEVTGVEVVGRTNTSDPLDIAFLKIKDVTGLNIKPIKLGDSDAVEVGDKVVAIGNALGEFSNTVTSGIISGFGRDIEASDGNGVETLQNLFQTDAAINSGNSGGPLVNAASEVIGINVATASAENISFAIPINDVKPLVDIVLETGKLERPYLGVRYVPLNAEIADELDIETEQGAYIPEGNARRPSIIAGSPAEKAGLAEKDIIVEIEGQTLDEDNTLVSILGKKRVGDTVTIKIIRDGQDQSLTAVLEASPEQ